MSVSRYTLSSSAGLLKFVFHLWTQEVFPGRYGLKPSNVRYRVTRDGEELAVDLNVVVVHVGAVGDGSASLTMVLESGRLGAT